MTDTNPDNFRRDREWYCPICLQTCHSVEQMQICQASHKEAFNQAGIQDATWVKGFHAWEKTLQERRKVFALVPVRKGE